MVLQNVPEFDRQRGDAYSFSVLGWDQLQYTGLQGVKDPGVWVVWTGCALLVLSSLAAFFVSHRRLWATLKPAGDKTVIRIVGSAHRNQAAFELFFEEFREKLQAELAGNESPSRAGKTTSHLCTETA